MGLRLRTFLALAVGLSTACTSTLDIERAKKLIRGPATPSIPVVGETTTNNLPTVEKMLAVSGELREIPLQWEPALGAGVAGYVIERSLSQEGPFSRIGLLPGRFDTTYIDRGDDLAPKQGREGLVGDLGDGETYHYRVRCYDSAGRISLASSAVSTANTAARPSPPEDLRIYSRLPGAVALAWRPTNDPLVQGYVIYRSPSPNGEFVEVGRTRHRYETTHTDHGLDPLRVFYYRVAAQNRAGGQGAMTAAMRGVTKPNPLPPIGLEVVERRLGANRLRWEPNVEADLASYQLFRARGPTTAKAELVTSVAAGANEAVDPEVLPGESLRYALVAVDSDGLASRRSDPVAVVSRGYELVGRSLAGGAALHWDAEVGAELARVLILREGGLGKQELGPVTGTDFVDRDVKPGARYRYRVVGIRPDGTQAPPSAPVEIRIPELPAAAGP